MAQVTDKQRHEFEAALAAALLLLYRKQHHAALRTLGTAADATLSVAALPSDVLAAIHAEAADGAEKLQAGINTRLQIALDKAREAGTPPADAVREAVAEIDAYNEKTLIPYYRSWAKHQALITTYQSTPAADGRTALDAHQWVWTQNTDFSDDCTSAASLSPASFNDLVAAAGGPPPTHRNCQCELSPIT